MRRDLLPMLCCPVCRGDLGLSVRKEDRDEILLGNLRCAACRIDYPIEDGIPNLLPPDSRD